jgi:hypothetical protein
VVPGLDRHGSHRTINRRAEQLGIHLQDLPRTAPEPIEVRSELYVMLQELTELKTEQARRKALLKLGQA